MITRILLVAALSTFTFAACSGDPDPTDGVDIGTFPDSAEVDTQVAPDTDEGADVDDTADAEVVCPEDRVPRVVDGVVVDPCGCCPIDSNYCHGHRVGGSPSPVTGACPVVADDAPPCSDGVDENGCATNYCSGSCI
ncbi:MAG: hypothetical protein EP329_07870 [Deltaproteobacteria bacterium]|nr:MAG: hypothetical protein EP329_07870 [Deltaproteobacteria bacterium]